MQKSKTFQERLFKELKPYLKIPKNKKTRAIFEDRLFRHLLGEQKPDDRLPIRKHTNRQKYLVQIFQEYKEIEDSLNRLELTLKLISRTPRSISKLDYIRYHYESYLNEVYIYKERINHLLDFLIKKCLKAKLSNEAIKIKRFKKTLNTMMSGIIKRRGSHVHVARYEDNKMDQLSGLEILSGEFDFLRILRDVELKKLRKEIKSEIKNNLEALKDILRKETYRHLGVIIFRTIPATQTTRRKS